MDDEKFASCGAGMMRERTPTLRSWDKKHQYDDGEREVGLLRSEIEAKQREITMLKQQNEENLKNQEERLKLDQ